MYFKKIVQHRHSQHRVGSKCPGQFQARLQRLLCKAEGSISLGVDASGFCFKTQNGTKTGLILLSGWLIASQTGGNGEDVQDGQNFKCRGGMLAT